MDVSKTTPTASAIGRRGERKTTAKYTATIQNFCWPGPLSWKVIKRVAVLLASISILSACSAASPTAITRNSADSSSPATQAPPPVGQKPVLSCKLPINSPAAAGVAPGGWVTFPGGQFSRDPASLPVRLQAHVPSYSWATQRWLPVESQYVAPGGDRYILIDDTSVPDPYNFYLVDVKTGNKRRVLLSGPPEALGTWQVIGFTEAGVYLASAGIQPITGLWLFDPTTGKVTVLDRSRYWSMVASGAAWGTNAEASGQEAVYRFDLSTHAIRSVFQGTGIGVLGVDDNGDLLVISGRGTSTTVTVVSESKPPRIVDVPVGIGTIDSGYSSNPGIWLALRPSGLALYTRANGITLMSSTVDVFAVAGGCW
jgi:hypothetical protein